MEVSGPGKKNRSRGELRGNMVGYGGHQTRQPKTPAAPTSN